MSTFIQFLTEEETFDKSENYIFDYQIVRRKLFNKLEDIVSSIQDEYDIPSRSSIEFLDLLQSIKQLVINNLREGDEFSEFSEMINMDTKKMIRLMYPDSNVVDFTRIIKREIIDKLVKVGAERLKLDIDQQDLTMDSTDEFGKLMYMIFNRILKKDSELTQNDLSDIKIWINKIKADGDSIQSLVKNSDRYKNKLYDKLDKTENPDELEPENDIEDNMSDDEFELK